MSSPVIQFKRGQAANIGIASFKAGEPGFTTDKYDFYIGLDGTADNQKFFGSSRYWEREDGSSAAQLKFVDKDGSNSINFQAPNTLSGIATWILPAYNAGAQNEFLKISSVDNNELTLDWSAVITTFDIAADSGTTDEVSTGSTITFAGTANEIETAVTDNQIQIGLPNDVTIGNNLTVTNNLFVNGSTTQVNVDTLTVDDPLIATGTTSGSAPGSDFAKDLGILMHYYSGSAKLASVYWDNSEGRMVMASVVTESSNVLTATSHATVEVGSLMLSDAAGTAESVITVSGSDRVLQNIIVDAGTF